MHTLPYDSLLCFSRNYRRWTASVFILFALISPCSLADEKLTGKELEFFELRIRPVLVEHCYQCHNSSETAEAEVRLDFREGLRESLTQDGDKYSTSESTLLQAIRHEIQGSEMPEGGPKLDDAVVADFEKWLEMGAPDPRADPPSMKELSALTSWETQLANRKQWWSFQPIRRPALPEVNEPDWQAPVDRFILSEMHKQHLSPSLQADPATLIRRVYFALIGLPPPYDKVQSFVQNPSNKAFEAIVAKLLESKHFGERWARHWMDWVRYAESHGSEGDPRLVGAELYRDYLIRALNEDVPYDQLLMEHVAGDLLPNPRVNSELQINESLIGTAHWRMVFHGFAPTDALDEKVRFTDDAINTFSKAFLGLTVSCARCHNHKFDAISQADYYAMFGILASTRPGRAAIDLPEKQNRHKERLAELKTEIRAALAKGWQQRLHATEQRLSAKDRNLMGALTGIKWKSETSTADYWRRLEEAFGAYQNQEEQFEASEKAVSWDLAAKKDYRSWFTHGAGLADSPALAGSFVVTTSGDQILKQVLPGGAYSHLLSDKHAARLESADFKLDGKYRVWLQVAGEGKAMSRYVVQNYPRNGTVFPVTEHRSRDWRWQNYDVKYWEGDDVHIELTTANDAPLLVKNQDRSWFGLRRVAVTAIDQAGPPSQDMSWLKPIIESAGEGGPKDPTELARLLTGVIEEAVEAWQAGEATDSQALLLDRCIVEQVLSNDLKQLPELGDLLIRYRELESDVPVATRVPTLSEWQAKDSPLFARGDHRQPETAVPRRFLEAIDDSPYRTRQSGRLELARDLLRADNPFTSRVIVNRVWHHLFGAGIVETTDNFGRLGSQPSHPELLDYLADRFRKEDRWSLKSLIRQIVLSETWQQASAPSTAAQANDPANRYLSHANVRRLEAEAIRDALLSAADSLDDSLFGRPVGGESNRRSVYVNVIRNRLDPFLTTFDAPVPFSTKGRRDVTNVPAQSLLMINNPRVRGLARTLAERTAGESDEAVRVAKMWAAAFNRPPSADESMAMLKFVHGLQAGYETQQLQLKRLQEQSEQIRPQLANILNPIRQRLQRELDLGTVPLLDLKPAAEWHFDSADKGDRFPTQLRGNAKIQDGVLVLDGNSWGETKNLGLDLKEKTLEVLVSLSNLNQKGGGAMTVQDSPGVIFDSIVFAERANREWMAGSNNFARTQDFGGAQEREAKEKPVHIVITYAKDGTITCYRDGQLYGRPYKSALQAFSGAKTMVVFGLRHGRGAGGGRMLSGAIHEAKLYDRALSADEVAGAAAMANKSISRKQVLAALSAKEREEVALLESQLQQVGAQIKAFKVPAEAEEWTDLSHSLFNMKEFLYVR